MINVIMWIRYTGCYNGIFGNLTDCFPVIQYLTKSRRCVNLDLVRLKIMGELAGRD
jgi:hypothetical protein